MNRTKLIGLISVLAITATMLAGCGNSNSSATTTSSNNPAEEVVTTEQTATPEIDDEDVDVIEEDTAEIEKPEDNIPDETEDDEDDIIDEEVLEDQKKVEEETGIAPEDQGKNNSSRSGSSSENPSSKSTETKSNGNNSSVNNTSTADYTPKIPTWESEYESTDTEITVKWKKVPNASGYRIYCYDNNEGWKIAGKIESGSTVTYTKKNLKSGTAYAFKIRSFRTVNGNTFWSKTSETKQAITYPANTSVNVTNFDTNSATFKWNSVACDGYELQRNTNDGWVKATNLSSNAVSCRVKNLDSGTLYQFRLKIYRNDTDNGYVMTTYSNVVTVTTKQIVTTRPADSNSAEPVATKKTTTLVTTKEPVTTTRETEKLTKPVTTTTTTAKPVTTTTKKSTSESTKPTTTTTTKTTTTPTTTTAKTTTTTKAPTTTPKTTATTPKPATTTTTTAKPKPTIIGYEYKAEVVPAVISTTITDKSYNIDTYGRTGKTGTLLYRTQAMCTGWDYLVNEINKQHGTTLKADRLKQAYENGEVEFHFDMPGCNTDETNAVDWYVNRRLYLRDYFLKKFSYLDKDDYDGWVKANAYDIVKPDWTEERFISYLTNWENNAFGKTSWAEYAFTIWVADITGNWQTDTACVLTWHKPTTKTISKAYATIQRTAAIYSDGTRKNITPVKTDLDTERAFLAKQGLTLDTSTSAWQTYLNT